MWLQGSSFILIAFVCCHQLVLLHVKACLGVVNTAFGFGSEAHTNAPDMLWATVSDRNRKLHRCSNQFCLPCRPLTVPCQGFILFLFESEQTPHGLCLPSFKSVQDGLTPGPTFASKAEYTVDMLHHSGTLHSPRHVFASANLHITPPCLACILHSFFKGNLASVLLGWVCILES